MRSGSLIGKDHMFISPKTWKSTSNGSTNAASRSRKRALTQGALCENFAARLGNRGAESDFVGNHYSREGPGACTCGALSHFLAVRRETGSSSLTRSERVPDGVSLPFSGQFSRRKKSDFYRKTTSFDIVFRVVLGRRPAGGFYRSWRTLGFKPDTLPKWSRNGCHVGLLYNGGGGLRTVIACY